MIAQKVVRWAGFGVLAVGSLLHAQQPQDGGWRQVTACAPDKGGYVCSRAGFHHVWHRAQTVQIETDAIDKAARAQIVEYLGSVGKTVAADGAPADLLFVLKPVYSNGVHIGPSGADLSVLSVYLMNEGKRGSLVWSETFNGQPDIRWPAVVHMTLEQFRSEFDHHKQ